MVSGVTGPAAEGLRVGWEQVPGPVRTAIEAVCGARVAGAWTQPGGFSPGLAARVRCQDGARFFVKAVSAHANPDSPGLHRQEGQVLAALDPLITGTAELDRGEIDPQHLQSVPSQVPGRR